MTSPGPLDQGGEDGGGGLHPPGGDVGHRGAGQGRPAIGGALAHVQVAADGEVVEVVPGPRGVGAVLGGTMGVAPARGGGPTLTTRAP